ncbi:MAG: M50 family metallopeptidase [Myxococcota bacterium]
MSEPRPSPGTITFTVLGIPVQVLPSFWIITLMMSSGRMQELLLVAEWAAVSLVSILVHELGHALVARSYRRTTRIELHGMGGTAFHSGDVELKPLQRIAISLAGPGAGLLFGAVAYALWVSPLERSSLMQQALRDALWINWGWGVLNLLPILPLDGGHVMQEVVNLISRRPNERAGVLISLVGAVGLLAAGLMWGKSSALVLLAWIAVHQLGRATVIYQEWRDEALTDDLQRLTRALAAGDGATLVAEGPKVLASARSPRVRATATQMLAWGHAMLERYRDAAEVLRQFPPGFHVDPNLLTLLAARAQPPEQVLPVVTELWSRVPDVMVGRWLVELLVRTGGVDRALELVMTAPRALIDQQAMFTVDEALFRAGRYHESLRVNEEMFARFQASSAAYNAACAHSRLGNTEAALTWLERAVAAGSSNPHELEHDEDLAPLRLHPRFQALLARVRERAVAAG